jgi:hypothetical protein
MPHKRTQPGGPASAASPTKPQKSGRASSLQFTLQNPTGKKRTCSIVSTEHRDKHGFLSLHFHSIINKSRFKAIVEKRPGRLWTEESDKPEQHTTRDRLLDAGLQDNLLRTIHQPSFTPGGDHHIVSGQSVHAYPRKSSHTGDIHQTSNTGPLSGLQPALAVNLESYLPTLNDAVPHAHQSPTQPRKRAESTEHLRLDTAQASAYKIPDLEAYRSSEPPSLKSGSLSAASTPLTPITGHPPSDQTQN